MIRFFDLLFSFLGLIILSPLLLIIAAAIVLDSRGSAFYLQTRVGRHDRDFRLIKFRTMHTGAEKKGGLTVGEKDPRITGTGFFLRKMKLDELPQLINVLKGEMSLVGPRPYLPEEFQSIPEEMQVFVNVRPGVTGLWQVSGRSNTDYAYRVALDAWYVRNWSLWLDVVILLKTIKVVLRGDGAY